jgi:hypothetical protein
MVQALSKKISSVKSYVKIINIKEKGCQTGKKGALNRESKYVEEEP